MLVKTKQHWIRFLRNAIIEPAFRPNDLEPTNMIVDDGVVFLVQTLRVYDEAVEAMDLQIEGGIILKKVPCNLFVFMDDKEVTYEQAYPTLSF